MCQTAQSCYRASQQRSEALKYAPAKVGTPGAWSASGANGYRAEIPYGVQGEEGVLLWSVCAFRLLPEACLSENSKAKQER
jgi:hypothetical protein